MNASVEVNQDELDRLVTHLLHAEAAPAPEEEVRSLLLAGNFGGAATALRRHCPALADNQWLHFQLKKQQFMRAASLATGPGRVASKEEREHHLQSALDLARHELAPLAMHSYMEAFSEFKHCMLALVSGSNGGGSGGKASSGDVGAASISGGGSGDASVGAMSSGPASAELREFAGMVTRAVRQELLNSSSSSSSSGGGGGSGSGGAGSRCGSHGGLLQLLRYLLPLNDYQHSSVFHPYWWPDTSAGSQALCGELLLAERDAMPPPALAEAAEGGGMHVGGVREHEVQALRTSLGCGREEAVALLRRSQGSAFLALQDAVQAVHINTGKLKNLAEEYAASRGLELPAQQAHHAQQAQQDQRSAAAAEGREAMEVDVEQPQQGQQASGGGGKQDQAQEAASGGGNQEHEQEQHQRPFKLARKGAAGAQAGMAATACGREDGMDVGEGGEEALQLPAELSEQQLRQVMRQLECQLSAGRAQQAIQQLQAADPSFLSDHPAATFALHRCCFLRLLAAPADAGGGTAAALAVVRQHLSPLAQQHPALLQPQLKATLGQLLPMPTSGASEGAEAAAEKAFKQGVADALAAVQSALRQRCHVRQAPLLTLLQELLSVHAAHFKLQRCQDRFAEELGIPALKAVAPSSAATAGAAAAAAGPSSIAAAAAMAAEAREALEAAGAAGRAGQQARAGEVPVPGVRVLERDSEDEEMQVESEEEEEEGLEDEGVGVPEQAILTVCEFTGLPRHTAIELLLVHGGDAAAVLAHVFP